MPTFKNMLGTPYKREYLGEGDNAIYATVDKISSIVKESYVNPYVRQWAEHIVNHISNNNKLAEVAAVHRFVWKHVRYTKDPYGMEYLQTPPHLLKMIEEGKRPHGDCDDMTMLSLSLLRSIGFPVAVKIASYQENGKFAHIYGLAYVHGKGWMPVECVRGDKPLGWQAPGITRQLEMEVR